MAGLDLSVASNVLKTFYLPPIQEMLNNSTVLLSQLERDSSTQTVDGTAFTVPLHTSRNDSAGIGRGENEALASADAQGYSKAVIPNKYIYAQVQVSGPVIAATKSNAGAFIRAIESEVKGAVRDMRRAVNRQLHSDGIDALGYVVSGAGSTSIVIDDGLGNEFTHFGTKAISVDVLDASSSLALLNTAVSFTLGAGNGTGYAATLGASLSGSAVAGDPIVVTGTKGKQMMGIAGIIDDSDPAVLGAGGLHARPVASNSDWKAKVIGSESTAVDLTFPLLQRGFSLIASSTDFTEADIKFLLCNYAVRDKYVELCTNERKFYNTLTFDGGFEAVDYNGKPLIPDPQCKRETLYVIVPETMKIFRTSDFDWMDKDGSVFSRVPGYDAYSATMFHYGDLGCIARNGNAVILGINE